MGVMPLLHWVSDLSELKHKLNSLWPVAYFTEEVNPSLKTKPLLVFNGDFAKLRLTSLVKEAAGGDTM